MMREVIIRYRVDDDSENQLFLARVFERFLEEGVTKIFAKAYTKKAVEELEAKEEIDGLQEPIVFFSEDGEIVRASSKESDGRDTQKGAGEEPILAED